MGTTNTFPVGGRFELHPAADRWMQGDRYGEVVRVTRQGIVHLRMDRSGRTLRCRPENIIPTRIT